MEDIVVKYITDEISREELKSLEDWLQIDENRVLFKEIIKTNQELDLTYNSFKENDAYKIIENRTAQKSTLKISLYRKTFKYTAILILFISISIGAHSIFKIENSNNSIVNEITLKLDDGSSKTIKNDINEEILNKKGELIATIFDGVLSYQINKEADLKPVYNELYVPYGKRIKVKMFDGTTVLINSGSKLRLPRTLIGQEKRVVFIEEGEAYFDVIKNKQSPFIVRTKAMDVRVLGTRFNVSSYDNDKRTFVALEEGSVAVNKPSESFNQENSIIINPGEKVIVKNDVFEVEQTNIEKNMAWSKGKLYFENDLFENIIKKLERYYNIDITNNFKELNEIRFTGKFTNENIDEVLNTFKELSSFNYSSEQNNFLITK